MKKTTSNIGQIQQELLNKDIDRTNISIDNNKKLKKNIIEAIKFIDQVHKLYHLIEIETEFEFYDDLDIIGVNVICKNTSKKVNYIFNAERTVFMSPVATRAYEPYLSVVNHVLDVVKHYYKERMTQMISQGDMEFMTEDEIKKENEAFSSSDMCCIDLTP